MKEEQIQFCKKVKELAISNPLINKSLYITCDKPHVNAATFISFNSYSELKPIFNKIFRDNYDETDFKKDDEFNNCRNVILNLILHKK